MFGGIAGHYDFLNHLLSANLDRGWRRAAADRLPPAPLERVLDLCAAGGFEAVRPAFEARFRMTGRRVGVIELGGGRLAGTVLGIAEDGTLRIEDDGGVERRVVAGDVTLAKEPA